MLLRDFALLLTVCLVWASNFVVSKLAVGTLNAPPLFFSAAIQKYEANLIASLTLMCPLMAIGLGVLVTGDHFDARMLFGTAIALAGVLLILLKPRKAAHLLSTVSTSMAQRP